MPSYPRWVSQKTDVNLREVGPNLYVGAYLAPMEKPFVLSIDLAGEYQTVLGPIRYMRNKKVLSFPIDDGVYIPSTMFDAIYEAVIAAIGQGPVLIHCKAGLSRSASVGYAMLRRIFGLPHQVALGRVQTSMGDAFPMKEPLQSARDWAEEALQRVARRRRKS